MRALRRRARSGRFVDLDLLPEAARPRRGRLFLVPLALAALGAAALLLTEAWELNLAARDETAQLQEQLARFDGELAVAQAELQLVGSRRGELEALELALADLEDDRRRVLGEPQQLSRTLTTVLRLLPPSATLEDAFGSDGDEPALTLVGVAPDAGVVLGYGAALEGEEFAGALITSIGAANPEDPAAGVRFSIELSR